MTTFHFQLLADFSEWKISRLQMGKTGAGSAGLILA